MNFRERKDLPWIIIIAAVVLVAVLFYVLVWA